MKDRGRHVELTFPSPTRPRTPTSSPFFTMRLISFNVGSSDVETHLNDPSLIDTSSSEPSRLMRSDDEVSTTVRASV